MDYEEFIELFNSDNVPKLTEKKIDEFFRKSCMYGHLEAAKWLWEISGDEINIHIRDNLFQYSCKYGRHFEVTKWLWEISKCTIASYILKKYHSKLPFLNTLSNKYKYKLTEKNDNLHMLHYYYKPVDGPGYLKATNDF